MPRGPEQKLAPIVMKWLDSFKPHIVVWKICDRHTSGIPDIIGLYKGRFFAIELKSPGKTPTDLQLHNIKRIITNGGKAIVATTLQEVEHFIETEF